MPGVQFVNAYADKNVVGEAWDILAWTLTLATVLVVVLVLVMMPIMLMVRLPLVPLVMRPPATSSVSRKILCWSIGPQREVVSLTKRILSHA